MFAGRAMNIADASSVFSLAAVRLLFLVLVSMDERMLADHLADMRFLPSLPADFH